MLSALIRERSGRRESDRQGRSGGLNHVGLEAPIRGGGTVDYGVGVLPDNHVAYVDRDAAREEPSRTVVDGTNHYILLCHRCLPRPRRLLTRPGVTPTPMLGQFALRDRHLHRAGHEGVKSAEVSDGARSLVEGDRRGALAGAQGSCVEDSSGGRLAVRPRVAGGGMWHAVVVRPGDRVSLVYRHGVWTVCHVLDADGYVFSHFSLPGAQAPISSFRWFAPPLGRQC